jgi:hypothetical protein
VYSTDSPEFTENISHMIRRECGEWHLFVNWPPGPTLPGTKMCWLISRRPFGISRGRLIGRLESLGFLIVSAGCDSSASAQSSRQIREISFQRLQPAPSPGVHGRRQLISGFCRQTAILLFRDDWIAIREKENNRGSFDSLRYLPPASKDRSSGTPVLHPSDEDLSPGTPVRSGCSG